MAATPRQIHPLIEFQASLDDGLNWKPAGTSAPTRLYVMKSAGATQGDTRYDLGAEKIVTYAAGKSSIADIATDLNTGIAAEIFYDPSEDDPAHPLTIYFKGFAQCSGNSLLLDHLSHGAGLATRTTHSWGGDPTLLCLYVYEQPPMQYIVSLRFILPANDMAAPNPHFSFHAVSEIGGALYDPSYGMVGMATAVELAPAFSVDAQGNIHCPPAPGDPYQYTPVQHTGSGFPTYQVMVPWTCPH